MSNVEIKAKVKNFDEFLSKAAAISDTPATTLKQIDTYFRVPNGRLKLRQIENETSELIFYDRPNVEGPKISSYSKQHFENFEEAEGLKKVLESSLGIIGVVKKKRMLYFTKRTRIHVDDVENLGHFMELEVILSDDETIEHGQQVANELMSRLEVFQSDLLSGSYIDLLINKHT